jgi:hypothetical protein
MMQGDESGAQQPAQPAETSPEAQRNLPQVLEQLGRLAEDGAVKAAAGYATVKALGKVFGSQGKGGGKPAPPPPPPPPQAE